MPDRTRGATAPTERIVDVGSYGRWELTPVGWRHRAPEVRPGLAADVERIVELYEREVELRARARCAELIPTRSEGARALFTAADVARRERLALLRRCELL